MDEAETEDGSELIQGAVQPEEKSKRKKPHSARFFDLDCTVDLESFESTKPKYLKQKERKRKKLEDREKRKLESQCQKRKRRTKDQIDFENNFKKQQKKIIAKRKASISASIDETIEEVVEEDTADSQPSDEHEYQLKQS